jgi:hypothetical protein
VAVSDPFDGEVELIWHRIGKQQQEQLGPPRGERRQERPMERLKAADALRTAQPEKKKAVKKLASRWYADVVRPFDAWKRSVTTP